MTTYLMEHPAEGERIERKTDVELTVSQLRYAGLRDGMRALDLGCAAGTTTRLMAKIVGASGHVHGVDGSPERIDDARRRTDASNVTFDVGAAESIPMGDASVDLVWSRFLFEYLPNPAAALKEMIRVARPGGSVVVSDLDGNCIWHAGMSASLQSEIDAALETFGDRFQPNVGRELPSLVLAGGLEDVAVDVRPYHVIAGQITEPFLSHWRMKLAGVRDALVGLGWAPRRATVLAERFEAHLLDPRTFTYSVLVTVRGTRPRMAGATQ